MKSIHLPEEKLNELAQKASERMIKASSIDANAPVSGEVLKTFSSHNQINKFLIFQVFQVWDMQINKLKHPYFNLENENVQATLNTLKSQISQHIEISAADFRPMLERAAYNNLKLIFNPEEAFGNFFFINQDSISLDLYKKYSQFFSDLDFVVNSILRFYEKNKLNKIDKGGFFEKMDKVLEIFNKKSDESFDNYRASIFQKITGDSIDSVLKEVDAQKKAEEAKIKAEEEAKKKAEEEAKKKAEEEAKIKAEEEAKKKAEEEAKKKAEEEAKKKAEEEAKKKAEEEAKKKAEEEARKKAEAEAKKKAEEEAKRKAEEEAKKKAEEEAKKKAEEEAKRKAEEEARKRDVSFFDEIESKVENVFDIDLDEELDTELKEKKEVVSKVEEVKEVIEKKVKEEPVVDIKPLVEPVKEVKAKVEKEFIDMANTMQPKKELEVPAPPKTKEPKMDEKPKPVLPKEVAPVDVKSKLEPVVEAKGESTSSFLDRFLSKEKTNGSSEKPAATITEKVDKPTSVLDKLNEKAKTVAETVNQKEDSPKQVLDNINGSKTIKLDEIPIHKQYQYVQKVFEGNNVRFRIIVDKINNSKDKAEVEDILSKFVLSNNNLDQNDAAVSEFIALLRNRF